MIVVTWVLPAQHAICLIIHSSCPLPLPLQSVGRAPPLESCASYATGPAGCAKATTVLTGVANATTAWVLEPASGAGRWYFRLQASVLRPPVTWCPWHTLLPHFNIPTL